MTSRCTFNADAFALFVHAQRQVKRNLTMVEAAEAIGITKAQLFRAEHRRPINTQAFLSICVWMGVHPCAFLLDNETGRTLADLPAADVSRQTSTETNERRQSLEGISL